MSPVDVATFVAAAGEVNRVTATYVTDNGLERGAWQFADTAATVIAGEGCSQIDEHRATCPSRPGGSFEGARIDLADGDDLLATDSDTTDSGGNVLSAEGGAGNDTLGVDSNWWVSLSGGEGDDHLSARTKSTERADDGDLIIPPGVHMNGGPGDDRLEGSPLRDFLDGGGGVDELLGRAGGDELTDGDRDTGDASRLPGPDRLDGGSGVDRVSYAQRTAAVSVDLASEAPAGEAGEGDLVSRVESAGGGRGDDLLAGNARANQIQGGRGSDQLIGRSGDDEVDPGSGDDHVSCGGGEDRVSNARRSTFAQRSCESLVWIDDSFAAYPTLLSGNRLLYEVFCPEVNDFDGRRPPPCAGSARISAASGPRRLLGAGAIARGRWEYPRAFRLVIPLTATGRRLAMRPQGVRAVVRFRFRKLPERKTAFAWTIRLKLPR
jgi:Ca2+-binding RTX toxin-like protein